MLPRSSIVDLTFEGYCQMFGVTQRVCQMSVKLLVIGRMWYSTLYSGDGWRRVRNRRIST